MEFDNVLMGNAMGCRHKNGCKLRDSVSTQIDSDFNEQAAIYLLQPNAADVIGNHVYGMENAHFINQQAIAPFGQDFANGYVPTKAMPIANNSFNVFVDNAGFGWYLNSMESDSNPLRPCLRVEGSRNRLYYTWEQLGVLGVVLMGWTWPHVRWRPAAAYIFWIAVVVLILWDLVVYLPCDRVLGLLHSKAQHVLEERSGRTKRPFAEVASRLFCL